MNVEALSPAGIAYQAVAAQTALTAQKMAIAMTKQSIEAQSAVVDLVASAAGNGPSANSAITGRGAMVDISV